MQAGILHSYADFQRKDAAIVQKLATLEAKQREIRAQIIDAERERAELEMDFNSDMEAALEK